MSEQRDPRGASTDRGYRQEEGGGPEPLSDDEPAIPEAVEELGGSGEVTPGDDNFPQTGRGRASEPGKPIGSP